MVALLPCSQMAEGKGSCWKCEKVLSHLEGLLASVTLGPTPNGFDTLQ